MVYFTCNACGEQLKKPSVEKHYTQKCRQCSMLTCIDCLKDFYGDEYKSHNSCMSEEQRYSKEGRAGWDPEKGQGNKGENRQKSWTANLRTILSETKNIDSDVKNIVNTILDHDNIPRKKPKFTNFVKNIMRNRASPHAIDKTWDLFSQALKPPAPNEAVNKKPEIEDANENKALSEESQEGNVENGVVKEKDKKKKKKDKQNKKELKTQEDETNSEEAMDVKEESTSKKKKKKKQKNDEADTEKENCSLKRKRDENMEVDNEDDETPSKKTKFDWNETITSLLLKKDGNEMKLNKLKKKCVNEFIAQHEGTHKSVEEIGAKFDKKIKKRQFRILKDKVKLIVDQEEEQKEVKEASPAKDNVKSTVPESESENKKSKSSMSFNMWEASNLGSDAQTEKFRRLMGIKSAPPPQAVNGKFGRSQRDDKKIFRDLEQGFEKARQAHFGGRCFDQ